MAVPTPALTLIDQLRRLVAESTQDTYDDAALSAVLQRYPLPDTTGLAPDATLWAGSWDVYRAAGDVWDEKAAAVVGNYDFSADGGDYKRSQAHSQMLAMARRFRSMRQASALVLQAQPRPDNAPGLMDWLGNAPEVD